MKWAVYQTERAWEAERGEVAYVSSMRGSVRAACEKLKVSSVRKGCPSGRANEQCV